MKYAFAAALLSAAQAVATQAEADVEWEPRSYYYEPVASATARDPWNYQASWSWDFDKIDDAAEEVYFGTDSESEINDETNDSWSSHEGFTDVNSDSSGTREDTIVHLNSSDDSDCDHDGHSSHCHTHSSESLHNDSDSHCHDKDGNITDCDSDSSHSSSYSHSSSHSSYSHSSSHSNDSSYPYSSESDGFHTPSDFGHTVGGYYYSGYHGNGRYPRDRYYVSGW